MKITQFLNKHKGFRQFLVKTGRFILLFILAQIVTIPFQKINLPKEFGISWLLFPELGNVVIFSVIAFFILSRDKLKKLKFVKISIKQNLLFGLLFLIGLSAYFCLKYYLSTHVNFAIKYVALFLIIQYALLVLFTVLLFLSVFGLNYSKNLLNNFRKEIKITGIAVIVSYLLIELIKNSWQYLSFAVTYVVYFMLNLSGLSPLMAFPSNKGPMLGAGDFIVTIGKPCSGIDSLTLFILLFLFILFVDWKVLNKKRMALIFIPGALGMFAVNILRIYALMLTGIFYSKDFAIGMFHSNAGWIFFIAYAFIYWYFTYGWVKEK